MKKGNVVAYKILSLPNDLNGFNLWINKLAKRCTLPDFFYGSVAGLCEDTLSDSPISVCDTLHPVETYKSHKPRYTTETCENRITKKTIVITARELNRTFSEHPFALALIQKALNEEFIVLVPQYDSTVIRITSLEMLKSALNGLSSRCNTATIGSKDDIFLFDQCELFKHSYKTLHLKPNRFTVEPEMRATELLRLLYDFPEITDIDLSKIPREAIRDWLRDGNQDEPCSINRLFLQLRSNAPPEGFEITLRCEQLENEFDAVLRDVINGNIGPEEYEKEAKIPRINILLKQFTIKLLRIKVSGIDDIFIKAYTQAFSCKLELDFSNVNLSSLDKIEHIESNIQINHAKNTECLILKASGIPLRSLVKILMCRVLRRLDLSDVCLKGLDLEAAKRLGEKLSYLTSLNLSNTGINPENLCALIGKAKALNHLDISKNNLDKLSPRLLDTYNIDLQNVEHLFLGDTDIPCGSLIYSSINDDEFNRHLLLSTPRALKELDLSGPQLCMLDPENIQTLKPILGNTQRLILNDAFMSIPLLIELASYPKCLIELHLKEYNFTSFSKSNIKKLGQALSTVQKLNLQNATLTQPLLIELLLYMTDLRELDLSLCKFYEGSYQELMPQLQSFIQLTVINVPLEPKKKSVQTLGSTHLQSKPSTNSSSTSTAFELKSAKKMGIKAFKPTTSNFQPRKGVVDLKTTLDPDLIFTLETNFYGRPEINQINVRREIRVFNPERRAIEDLVPNYKILYVSKSDCRLSKPIVGGQYLGIVDVPIGTACKIKTISSNQSMESWWCDNPNICPRFTEDKNLGSVSVYIPPIQTLEEKITLQFIVKNNLPFFDRNKRSIYETRPHECKRIDINPDAPLYKALKIIDIETLLSYETEDTLFQHLKTFFGQFKQEKPEPWHEIVSKFPDLRTFDLNETEKNILCILVSKVGICRHIAWAAHIILSTYFGIESRMPQNDIHEFVEVQLENFSEAPHHWYALDIGWTGTIQTIRKDALESVKKADKVTPYKQDLLKYITVPHINLDSDHLDFSLADKTLFIIPKKDFETTRLSLLAQVSASTQNQVTYIENETMLFELFSKHPHLQTVFIVVNWSTFEGKNRVAIQSILETPPTLNGQPFNVAGVISLYVNEENELTDAAIIKKIPNDFRTRHPKMIFLSGTQTDFLHLPTSSCPSNKQELRIDLRNGDCNWMTRLTGYIDVNLEERHPVFEFRPGILSTLTFQDHLTIINPPKSRKFLLFLQELIRNGGFLEQTDPIKTSHTWKKLPDTFSFSLSKIERKKIKYRTLDEITILNTQKTNQFWIITPQNHSLYLPHHACTHPQKMDQTAISLVAHRGFAKEMSEQHAIACFHPDISPDIQAMIQEHLEADIPLVEFEKQFLNHRTCENSTPGNSRYYLSSNTGLSDLLFTHQFENGELTVQNHPLWEELQQPGDIELYGLTSLHPLYETFVIAQKMGYLLTPDIRIEVLATLHIMEQPTPVNPRISAPHTLRCTDIDALTTVKQLLNEQRLILFTGKPGTGKSEMIYKLIKDRAITAYYGLEKLINFLESPDNNATLIIEEFNLLKSGALDLLFGIFDTNPHILFNGQKKEVGVDKKIILLGNPNNQIGRAKSNIEAYSFTLTFEEISAETMVENTLSIMPLTLKDNHWKAEFLSHVIPFVQFVRKVLPEYPISFRDIQMIARVSHSEITDDIHWTILNACRNELAYFFSRANKEPELKNWLETLGFIYPENDGPHETIRYLVNSQIYFRQLDWQELDHETFPAYTRTFGKSGILFEGESGIGKSTMLRCALENLGFSHNNSDPLYSYCIISLQSGQSKVIRNRLKLAAKRGEVVILDELNTNPGMIEDILTEIMSSGSVGSSIAVHPGFRIFATQNNSREMGNRQSLPESELSRFQCINLPELSFDDFNAILQGDACEELFRAFLELKQTHDITPRVVKQMLDSKK